MIHNNLIYIFLKEFSNLPVGIAANTASRGIMYYNFHPAPNRFQAFHKPQWIQSNRVLLGNQQTIRNVIERSFTSKQFGLSWHTTCLETIPFEVHIRKYARKPIDYSLQQIGTLNPFSTPGNKSSHQQPMIYQSYLQQQQQNEQNSLHPPVLEDDIEEI
jgi:hypothetical protein